MQTVAISFVSTLFTGAVATDGSTCNYTPFSPEAEQAFLDECGVDYEITACEPAYQDELEKAISTELYSQCNCVYYDIDMAFNYKSNTDCWIMRPRENGGRCWTHAWKTYYTSGSLEENLNNICGTGATTAPPPGDDGCTNDPDGLLAAFPTTCAAILDLTGGCDMGMIGRFLAALFGDHVTPLTLCPGFCDESCPDEEEDTHTFVCQDDPRGMLANLYQTDCEAMLRDLNGCEDPHGIVPLAFPNETPQTICPESCHPDCQ